MPITHTYRVYFVRYTPRNEDFVCVCPKCTNAYGEADVLDLYDTSRFKIGLLTES